MSALQQVDWFGIVFPDRWTSIPTDQRQYEEFCNAARAQWRQAPGWDRALERPT